MKSLLAWIGIVCCVFIGCRKDWQDDTKEETQLHTRLDFTAGVTIEKSQVLFFRNLVEGDTLVCQMEIEGPKKEFDEHTFRVPAGYYQAKLIGNGEADHIHFSGLPSIENTWIEYAGGTQPPDLYYTTIYVKAGEQKKVGAGMLILTSRITLTVEKIPAEVRRIRVELKNTSDGVYLNLHLRKKVTDPCISEELNDLVSGSSPEIHLRSFPSYPAADTTFLQVYGFDTDNRMLYEGRSVSFRLGGSEDIRIRCNFRTGKQISPISCFPASDEESLPCFGLQKKRN